MKIKLAITSIKEKLKLFEENIALHIQYLAIIFELFLTKSRVTNAKHNWRNTRNSNLYNPTLAATVYTYGEYWKMARHDTHSQSFQSKEDAKKLALNEWLEEKKLDLAISQLEKKLQNIKAQFQNTHDATMLDTSNQHNIQEKAKSKRVNR